MRIATALAALALLTLTACSSSTTGGGSSGTTSADGGDGGSGGGEGGASARWCGAPKIQEQRDNACEACLNQACCKEADACGASDDCVACLAANPIPQACGQQTQFAAVASCVTGPGATACKAQCSGSSSGGTSSSGGVCKQQNDICQPLGGECCVGLTCCELTNPPSCQTTAACL